MEKVLEIQRSVRRRRLLPAVVIGVALAVLGVTILLAGLNLREQIRAQITGRDGELFQAFSRLEQSDDASGQEALGSFADPAEQFDHILQISRLNEGVLAVRLFTPDGTFTNAFPALVTEGTLTPEDLATLRTLQPVSHFHPRASLASVNMLVSDDAAATRIPLLEVNVPLHVKDQSRLLGVAQFILRGDGIAREYAALDRHLAVQAVIAFAAAGGILAVVLALAFRRLQRANGLLAERTERLLQANHELVLAAKTSAVGAVTSHLIHGLKNPLSGLQGFVKSHVTGQATETGADWQDAMDTTQRMQALIGGVVRVLEEQQAVAHYEISTGELVEIISARMLPVARAAGVHFFAQARGEGMLGNREANLMILILENLIQNGLQATPEGKSVRLEVSAAGGEIQCAVRDEGPGFPAELRERLFTPCRSTKAGGSGLGLAISKQLAAQIGATLELAESSPEGCRFRLTLPQKPAAPDAAAMKEEMK